MAFRVKFNGVDIECDTADDAMAMAQRLSGGPLPAGGGGNGTSTTASSSEQVARVKNMCAKLREVQKEILMAIAEQSFGKQDRNLWAVAKIDPAMGNKALGGTMSGIAKIANGVGLTSEDLYTTKAADVGGQVVKEYRPTDLLRAAGKELGWTIH